MGAAVTAENLGRVARRQLPIFQLVSAGRGRPDFMTPVVGLIVVLVTVTDVALVVAGVEVLVRGELAVLQGHEEKFPKAFKALAQFFLRAWQAGTADESLLILPLICALHPLLSPQFT